MPNTFLDRVGQVVKSEWTARFGEDGEPLPEVNEEDFEVSETDGSSGAVDAKGGRRVTSPADLPLARGTMKKRRGVSEADQAYRLLELSPGATLDVVRDRYFELAQRYHPRTIGDSADKAYAAQTVLETLTDALEILETHLLPVVESKPEGGD